MKMGTRLPPASGWRRQVRLSPQRLNRCTSAIGVGCSSGRQPPLEEVALPTVVDVVVLLLVVGTRAYQYQMATAMTEDDYQATEAAKKAFHLCKARGLAKRENTPAQAVHASCPAHLCRSDRRLRLPGARPAS